jgi:RNase P/RNase MRP subunit POP5
MATVGEDYLGIQIFRENFVSIQQAIGHLVGELHEGGLTPRLINSYWAKGAAIMVCQEQTRYWLAARVPTLEAWEGSRLKMVGLDALPTYKRVLT